MVGLNILQKIDSYLDRLVWAGMAVSFSAYVIYVLGSSQRFTEATLIGLLQIAGWFSAGVILCSIYSIVFRLIFRHFEVENRERRIRRRILSLVSALFLFAVQGYILAIISS